MDKQIFTLYCEYIHCCGKKTIDLGTTDSLDAAAEWAEEQNRRGRPPRLPADDLIKTCPVRHCPAKLQIPRYGYASAPPLPELKRQRISSSFRFQAGTGPG